MLHVVGALIFVPLRIIEVSSCYAAIVQWPVVVSFCTAIYKPFNQFNIPACNGEYEGDKQDSPSRVTLFKLKLW